MGEGRGRPPFPRRSHPPPQGPFCPDPGRGRHCLRRRSHPPRRQGPDWPGLDWPGLDWPERHQDCQTARHQRRCRRRARPRWPAHRWRLRRTPCRMPLRRASSHRLPPGRGWSMLSLGWCRPWPSSVPGHPRTGWSCRRHPRWAILGRRIWFGRDRQIRYQCHRG